MGKYLSDLTFGAPVWFWALLALPALVALFVWAERRGTRRLVRLIHEPRLRARLTAAASAPRRRWRYAFLLAAAACFIVALAQPRLGFETQEVHRRGLDVMVIVDVSKSMLATDTPPDRLTRAKLSVQDLLEQLQGDRVGLVAFAGSAFLQAPLTIDYDAVLTATRELDPDLIPLGGTNIGGAIDLALSAFGKAAAGNRAILLLSDGEPTSDGEQASGVEAAKRAAADGVKLFTVGFGTPDGSLIPLTGARRGEFVRDEDGKIVRTRLNEAGLTELAHEGGGFYLRFTSGEAVMRTVIQDGLSKLRAGEIDARTNRRPIERFQWPLAVGIFFLALSALPGERRRQKITTPGSPTTKRAAVATLALLFLCLAASANAESSPPPKPADGDATSAPLSLYQSGKYDEAFRAFTDLSKEHPDQSSLPFDAGASAYMGKQYDEALESFGKALTAPNPGLRAKADYNFGNTLFRRGETQKDQKEKLTDWRNAIQHYDSTLERIKSGAVPDPLHRLAESTAFNRDLVQKRIEEESKKAPTPPPQSSPSKKDDKSDKSDKSNPAQQNQSKSSPSKDDQSKSDQSKSDQSKDDQKQPGQQDQPPSAQSSPSPGSQPPQPSPGGESKPDQQKSPGQNGQPNQASPPPNPSEGQNQAGQDQTAQNSGRPTPGDVPKQDEARQRGDFHANPSGTPPGEQAQASPAEKGEPTGSPPPDEEGKMSMAQARALLDSLRNEDARVMLNDLEKRHNRDDTPAKDW